MKLLKFFLFYILLFYTPVLVLGQEKLDVDSLIKLLKLPSPDSAKIKLLIELSKNEKDSVLQFNYAERALELSGKLNEQKYTALTNKNKAALLESYSKHRDAIPYYKSALILFEQLNDSALIAATQYELGTLYYRINDFQTSLDFHKKALEYRRLLKDTSKLIQSESAVAVMYWRMGNLTEAEKYYEKALKLNRIKGRIKEESSTLNSLGAIYWGEGNFEKAFSNFEKALKIANKIGDDEKYVLIINNIGLIYQEWDKNDKAMENYREGLKVAQKEKYHYGLAYSYSNIGKIYLLRNENEKALLNFDSALVNYLKIEKQIGVAYAYRNMGDAYAGMKNYNRAVEFYKLSVKTARSVKSRQHLSRALSSLGNTYFYKRNYLWAKETVNQSLAISLQEDYQDITKDNYFLLSKISEVFGKYAKALYYYKKGTEIKDNILNKKNSKQIAEMQIKYETEKNKRENEVLRKEEQLKTLKLEASESQIQKQNILLLSFVFLFILLAVFIFLLYKNRNKIAKSSALLTTQNREIKLQKEELSVKGENLKEINVLLHGKTKDLESKTSELQDAVIKLEKATQYKNKMFSIIGHDLRGPVGTISSIISLAMDNRLDEKKRKKLLSATKESAVAAYTLLENLLIWANNEQGNIKYQPTTILLKQIVNSNIGLLKETINKKGLNISVDIEDGTKIYADFNTVDTIFRNLISNAIKFTNPNGAINISAIKIEHFIEITVKDTGIGISPEELTKILDIEKYYSNQGTGGEQGSGLGLQLCFEFIKMNKGTYQIKSQIGKGTDFIFSLPCCDKLDA